MAKALVPMADGFEEVEAIAVIDVLRRGGVEVVSASIGRSLEVKGAHGIVVKADAFFADVADEAYDAIVLPGGGEGTENLKNSDALKPAIFALAQKPLYQGIGILEVFRSLSAAGQDDCVICLVGDIRKKGIGLDHNAMGALHFKRTPDRRGYDFNAAAPEHVYHGNGFYFFEAVCHRNQGRCHFQCFLR